jgi:hypothetical protein
MVFRDQRDELVTLAAPGVAHSWHEEKRGAERAADHDRIVVALAVRARRPGGRRGRGSHNDRTMGMAIVSAATGRKDLFGRNDVRSRGGANE